MLFQCSFQKTHPLCHNHYHHNHYFNEMHQFLMRFFFSLLLSRPPTSSSIINNAQHPSQIIRAFHLALHCMDTHEFTALDEA